MNDNTQVSKHVDEMLSGFVDGELTQQQAQRVRVHVEACPACAAALSSIRAVRERVGAAQLSAIDRDQWRESMNDPTVNVTRGIGWLVFIGATLVAAGALILEILLDSGISTAEKFIVGGIYGGLLLLFLSVLRQRLIERKTDKYKDVEI